MRKGAFITFPSGAFTPAPASVEVNSINQPGRELIDQTYTLYYDLAYSRWLPVHRNAVAPDGAHYAYTDRPVTPAPDTPARATLHVVEVKTGAEQTFDGGDWADPYEVLDYSVDGVYLITRSRVGVWLLDPATGNVTRPIHLANVQAYAGGGRFWAGLANQQDPNPINATAPDEVDLVNPADSSRTQWFYRSGTSAHVVTQDGGGHPIVILSTAELNSQELVYLTAPNSSVEIVKGNLPSISDPLPDSHGVWFGATDGIYLYTIQNGVQKVSDQGGWPSNGCS